MVGRRLPLRRSQLEAQWDSRSRTGEVNVAASVVCLFGLLLQFVLSGPLLVTHGFAYTDVGGPPWQKIHPGSYFILVSLAMVIFGSRDPLDRLIRLVAHSRVFCLALFINILLSVWVVVRGGVGGLGTMIDTYWAPMTAAIVLSNAPRWLCRRAVAGFLFLCVLDAVIGIGEGILHQRLFTFAPDSSVVHETEFRASALVGHPLDNAQMISIGIFILLGTRVFTWLKVPLIAVLFASLVAFGARAALAFSILGFFAWGVSAAWRQMRSGTLGVLPILLIAIGLLTVPMMLLGLIDLSIHSAIGVRLQEASLDDASAQARLVAWDVIRKLTARDLWLGVSLQHEISIEHTLSPEQLGADIENPWILMLMYLGIVGFVIWFAALAMFALQLVKRAPFAIQLAVVSFFVVGSTANSFGRRSLVFGPMVAAVLCASMANARPILRLAPRRRSETGATLPADRRSYIG
jgi:hypothetical protein